MKKEHLYLTIAVVIILLGASAATAAPKPNVWDAITDLWTNATEQQSVIQAEVGARTADDLALWTNATEQQSALVAEASARGSADANLQSQIDALPDSVHFGEWDESLIWQRNQVYQADTDGFLCVSVLNRRQPNNTLPNPWEEVVFVYGWTSSTLDENGHIVGNAKSINTVEVGKYGGFIMPVRAGDYWEVEIDDPMRNNPNDPWLLCFIQWIPLIT